MGKAKEVLTCLTEELNRGLLEWLYSLVSSYGYIGVFLMSLISCLSIGFPIPYTAILFSLGALPSFNLILLAISAGIGAALGQSFSYIVGLSSRRFVSIDTKKKFKVISMIFEKYRYGSSIVAFLFAFTPLPDYLFFLPMGVIKYPFLKIFIPCIVGKFMMSLLLVYGGRKAFSILLQIFGGESPWTISLVISIITILILVAALIAMVKIDWESILERVYLKASSFPHHRNKTPTS